MNHITFVTDADCAKINYPNNADKWMKLYRYTSSCSETTCKVLSNIKLGSALSVESPKAERKESNTIFTLKSLAPLTS